MSLGFKIIRFGLRVADRLAPNARAWLAYRLFCSTDGRQPKGEKQKRVYADGLALLAQARQMRLVIPTGTVMTYHFEATVTNAQRVLIVHGWGSQAVYLARMAHGLAGAGLEVVVLDLPGHGLSSGRTLDIGRAVEAIAAANRHYRGFDAIVGHSFGGAASLIAVSGLLSTVARVGTNRLVLIGAPSRLDFIFRGFADTVGLSEASLRRLEMQAERRTGVHPMQFDGPVLALKADIPVLVIHAEDDKEVAAENARRYEDLSGKIELLWANGLGHRRIVSDSAVIAATATFIHRKEESPPSEPTAPR